MFRKACRASLLVTLCLSVGGQWAALQSVAWGSMLVKYSARAPLAQAIAETFDGQHPCGLCKGVTAAQQSEKKPAQTASNLTKHDLICAIRGKPFIPEFRRLDYVHGAMPFSARTHLPPLPPPRAELG